jgi:hypothetical protein
MIPTAPDRTATVTPGLLAVTQQPGAGTGAQTALPDSGAGTWLVFLLAALVVLGLALLGYLWKHKS